MSDNECVVIKLTTIVDLLQMVEQAVLILEDHGYRATPENINDCMQAVKKEARLNT